MPEVIPSIGEHRKILCYTFAENVQEYDEVLEGLTLGYEPETNEWFLSRGHDKDVIFPEKPKRGMLDDANLATKSGASFKEVLEMEWALDKTVSQKQNDEELKRIENVQLHTKIDVQNALCFYEQAKEQKYNVWADGTFVVWLFERAGRLLETGSV